MVINMVDDSIETANKASVPGGGHEDGLGGAASGERPRQWPRPREGGRLALASAGAPPDGRNKRNKREEQAPPPPAPQFALRTDGAILLSTADMGDRDLNGYELWPCVVVPARDRVRVGEVLSNAEQECAAHIIAKLPRAGEQS